MPKTKGKRQSTATKTKPVKRLGRTKKSPAKTTSRNSKSTKNQQTKANYFDLVAQPNNAIRSKSTGNFISAPKPPRNLKVPEDWDVAAGDVISWSEGRPTETFFVTNEGILLKNPDTSGSGYLTIPLAITSQYPDALDYFSVVLDGVGRNYVSSVELAPTDAFFSANFSKQQLPAAIQKRNDISYSFDPNDEVLYVTLASNPKQSQDFSLNTTKLNDIVQYISTGNDTKAKLIVKYDFQGKENCSKVPRGIIAGLPAGWQCEQQGSTTFSANKIQGEWKCEGPEKTKEKARKAIEKHYKGLNNFSRIASASANMEQPARYIDLVNKPETLKRKGGIPVADSEFKDIPAQGVSVPDDWEVSFGDVLNWSKGRPTEAYFVLEDRTLLKNPDRNGSGYLTIPFRVTRNSRNALLRYEYVIQGIGKDYVSTVEMHPQDVFIEKNWGQVPSDMISRNVEFIFDPLEEFLYANIPHTKKSKEFKLGSTTMDDIHKWFVGAMEDQASFRIKFNFAGPQYQKYHELYRLQNQNFSLPKTWSVEPGTTDIGHDHCHGEWIFHGDRQHLNEAKKNAQDFYKDLPVTVEDIQHK